MTGKNIFVKNVLLLNGNEDCVFKRMYGEDEVDSKQLADFLSTVNSFAATMFNEQISTLEFESTKIFIKKLSNKTQGSENEEDSGGTFQNAAHVPQTAGYALIFQSPRDVNELIVKTLIKTVEKLLIFFSGPVKNWTPSTLKVENCQNLLDSVFVSAKTDFYWLIAGHPQIVSDGNLSWRVARSLISAEEGSGHIVAENGVMLVLGSRVFHTRMASEDTQMILHIIRTRPLEPGEQRSMPVFSTSVGAWKSLCLAHINQFIAAFFTNISATGADVGHALHTLTDALASCPASLPVEEPPLLLRHFAGRDVLVLIFHNTRTGAVYSPQLRPGPSVEKMQIQKAFWWFFTQVSQLQSSEFNQVRLEKDLYKFVATTFPQGLTLYLMFSNESTDLDKAANEVFNRVAIRLGE
eukprot:GCRY01003195.1.p1 GENE.GCRY01003195.1~~GCRY01003195.1.p1  ORF type:complete len:409 (-),score=67.99 GCRY01003195.1:331-1557(-)